MKIGQLEWGVGVWGSKLKERTSECRAAERALLCRWWSLPKEECTCLLFAACLQVSPI